MIARLSSAVFYTTTRKLLGAFYVDQKKKVLPPSTLPSEHKQWGSQIVALNGVTQSFTLPLTISYAMAAVITMRSGDFSGFVACPYWTECTKNTIMITPDYETQQGYTGTGKSTVTWILLAI